MAAAPLVVLIPTRPEVRAEAKRIADHFASDFREAGEVGEVGEVLLSMLDAVVRGYKVTVIRAIQEAVERDRKAEVAAYVKAAKKANALLSELGMTEDEAVTEFDALRGAKRSTAGQD